MKKAIWITLAVALAVIAATGAFTARAGPFSLGPLVQISGTSPFATCSADNISSQPGEVFLDSEVEPWVAVNPRDADNIVAFWQQDRWTTGGARGNVAGVSFDGGATWTSVVVPGLSVCSDGDFLRASDPWLSFAPDGTLHQVSIAVDPFTQGLGVGANALLASKSEDGGLTWSDPITIAEEPDGLNILHDKESITADSTDSDFVYVVWDRLRLPPSVIVAPENAVGLGFKSPVYFSRSTDGGQTWESARKIYDPGGNNQTIGNQIVVLPEGTLVDFFVEFLNVRNDDGGPQGDLHLSLLRSPDKGRTWLPNGRPIRSNRLFPLGVITPDNTLPVRDAADLFDVAVDPQTGSLYAVWQDARFTGFDQVAFAMSLDGGFTWSTPIPVNQTPAKADNPLRQQAFIPSVEVGANGTVGVTYYDFRNDDDSGELADYWIVHCHGGCDEAANWGDENRLTDASFDISLSPLIPGRGFFLGDYVGLASDGSDFLNVFTISGVSDPANEFFRRAIP